MQWIRPEDEETEMDAEQVLHDPTQVLAVVGMAGRFPQAPDVPRLWELLDERRDAVAGVPAERWDATEQFDPELSIQTVGGFLEGIDRFDATFFGISPREAEVMDPQQRLMLETCWQALEDAGVPAKSLAGSRIGTYFGASWHDYEFLRKDRGARPTQHSSVGTAFDVIASRVAYFLGLTGPSLTVETGCSSSLVALHLAAQALRAGEIDAALTGGVSLIITPEGSVGLTHFGGLSPTGRCRTFSASADGFVRGEGIAAVYLKTLARALEDGDRIHALIADTRVNNDGGGESLVTPNPDGQENLLRAIYENPAFPIDDVVYVEAHGTGTRRGDPIEAGVVGRVLGQRRDPSRGPLLIGSVKTNIGHLEAASGMAGLFKALLILKHRKIPASLHAEELNPEIPFDELNLQVTREPVDLPADGRLMVGVNSFGWGGTNAHVVLATPPETARPTADGVGPAFPEGTPVLLPLSAHSPQALRERARDLSTVLADGTAELTSLAGTLAWQRDHFPVRAALTVEGPEQARELLERMAGPAGSDSADSDAGSDSEGSADTVESDIPGVVIGRAAETGRTAFVFPGQGSQWADMGRELLAADPVFAETLHRCAEALRPHVDWDPVEVVSGAAGDEWLSRIDMLQPVLWAVSVSLAEVWRHAGVEPDMVIGHSQGEITAATVAGVLSYEDAALVVARRSAIARRTSGNGLMLAVDLSVEEAHEALRGFEADVSLAVNNGPTSCVLSGRNDMVELLKELLEAQGTFCRLVNVDYASHSPQMDPLEDDLLTALAPARPREGSTELLSTVRLTSLRGPEMDASYWVENLRRPVMFADALEQAFDSGVTHVVEISPHPVLAPAIEQAAARRSVQPRVLTTLRRDQGSPRDLADTLARAWTAGLAPLGRLPRRTWAPVPSYPWQRTSYWVPDARPRSGLRSGLDVELVPAVGEVDTWTAMLEPSLEELPWLRDHKVHEAVVLPGTAMLTLAVRTALARTGAAPAALADVAFLSDLTFGPEETARVAVRWRDDTGGAGAFSLSSLPAGTNVWTEHLTARVLTSAGTDTAVVGFPEILLDTEPTGPDDFYAAHAARGLHYGPGFRGVRALHRTDDESLAEVHLPEPCLAGARAHDIHPALWDGALQACLPLVDHDGAAVPSSVRRIRLLQDPSEPVTTVWSHVVRREPFLFDLHLYDGSRRPLMTLEGLGLTPLLTADAESDDTERLHRAVFVPLPRTQDGDQAGAGADAGSWLVCAGPAAGDRAAVLMRALTDAGSPAGTAVFPDDPTDEAGWAQCLETAGQPSRIAFLAPDRDAGLAVQKDGLLALTALARACLTLPVPPRLVVITSEAQAVAHHDLPDPGGALYWGFGRVLRREHAELRLLLLDVRTGDEGWPGACAAELAAPEDDDQVVLRGAERFAARLRRGAAGLEPGDSDGTALPWHTPDQPFRLSPDRPGSWDGLAFRPQIRRAPAPGEIEIATSATGLNFIDVMKAMGTYPDPAGAGLLGVDGTGVVTRVGSGVDGLAKGDRVVLSSLGVLASHHTLRADHARLMTAGAAGMSDAEAAALPSVLMTAWYGLADLAGLAAGETVLIHSATGGLGLAALQVARLLGADVIATAGNEKKRGYLAELGVQHVFDSRDLSWAESVMEVTGGRGVDVVLNSLSGSAVERGLDVLAEDGRFVEVGKKDIYSGRALRLDPFRKGIALFSVDLGGLMLRRPERFARLLADVWELVEAESLTPLPVNTYSFADAAEALREMSRGEHIGKFVLTDPGSVRSVVPEPLPGGRFRSDSTYLISGGLGALGLSLAEFMADRGAGALALAGRSAPTPQAASRIDALLARGVRVRTFQADVADEQAVTELVRQVRSELPPLRGVVHAAGLLDDATVATVRPEQVRRVLAPKVDGARHLDAATADDALDLFVLFSSAAGLFGNAGQAAYASGNTYLDALAQARRRRGLPALSVQWGAFSDVGLATLDERRGARLEERGMTGFTTGEAWQALERLLGGDEQVVGYVPVDLRKWFESSPDTAALASWNDLREAARGGQDSGGTGTAFRAELAAAGEDRRTALLAAKVRELVSRVLRLDASVIDEETPFKALGLDSLMSLELRNRLEATLGTKLSPTLLWTYGSVRALSGVLAEQLSSADDSASSARPVTTSDKEWQ